MTVIELLVSVVIMGMLLIPATTVMIFYYGNTIRTNMQSRLAVESQNILRSVVEELRVSSGVRPSSTINDPNAPPGGWTTSNANLVLIVSTPVIDADNNYVMNAATGEPYQNELVYYAMDGTLYKRYLANPAAAGNRFKTSCPAALAIASCPADVVISRHFKDMNFIFYDQDDAVTSTLTAARSIKLTIQLERRVFGEVLTFENSIRVTLRNTL